jgi:rod shape-determining protein MreD
VRSRRIAAALALVVLAVVLQGAVFGEGRVQAFDASPSIIVAVLVATVRHLDPEPALLVGFTAGLLTDLLGGSPLGLWAMSLTVVSYVTLRVRDQADNGPLVIGLGVFGLTLLAHGLFALAGTFFGQRTLVDPDVVHLLLLPALYTALISAIIIPLSTLVMRGRRVKGWAA